MGVKNFTPIVVSGGEGGIRTLGGRKPSPVFKTGTFNRSVTSPSVKPRRINEITIRTEAPRAKKRGTIPLLFSSNLPKQVYLDNFYLRGSRQYE